MSMNIRLGAEVIQDAKDQIEKLSVWPKSFKESEIKAARQDLLKRLAKFVVGLVAEDPLALSFLEVVEQRAGAMLFNADKAGPLQAVAVIVKDPMGLVVVKIWVHSTYPDKGGLP